MKIKSKRHFFSLTTTASLSSIISIDATNNNNNQVNTSDFQKFQGSNPFIQSPTGRIQSAAYFQNQVISNANNNNNIDDDVTIQRTNLYADTILGLNFEDGSDDKYGNLYESDFDDFNANSFYSMSESHIIEDQDGNTSDTKDFEGHYSKQVIDEITEAMESDDYEKFLFGGGGDSHDKKSVSSKNDRQLARSNSSNGNDDNNDDDETEQESWPNESTEEIGTGVTKKRSNKMTGRSMLNNDSSEENQNDHQNAFQDDILLSPEQNRYLNKMGYNTKPAINMLGMKRSMKSKKLQNYWTDYHSFSGNGNFVIPYALHSFFKTNSVYAETIRSAIQDIQDNTCIEFVEVELNQSQYKDFVHFIPYNSPFVCLSHIGKVGGKQPIFLGDTFSCSACLKKFGYIQHEIMHTLGFWHEHNRMDRDNHVEVLWQNIMTEGCGRNPDGSPGCWRNFYKIDSGTTVGEYDKSSIMHYGGYSWSVQSPRNGNQGLPTIIDRETKLPIKSQRDGITDKDLTSINLLYRCNKINRWGNWNSWSSCTATCGENGYRSRSRNCLNDCTGNESDGIEIENCNRFKCKAEWGPWSDWTTCSAACGKGTQKRERNCQDADEKLCEGEKYQLRICLLQICPPKALWKTWSAWSTCQAIEGDKTNRGIRSRERECSSAIEPQSCGPISESIQSESCSPQPLDLCNARSSSSKHKLSDFEPSWGSWSSWSNCNKDCDTGHKIRDRQCENGSGCQGHPIEMTQCNTQPCDKNRISNQWIIFSSCSRTCGTGFQTLKLTDPACNSGKPDSNGVIKTNDGTPCFKNEKCNVEPCPTISAWSSWTSCLGYGTHGIQKRTRKCNNDNNDQKQDQCTQSIYQTKSCLIPKSSCPQATCAAIEAPLGGLLRCSSENSSNSLCRLSCLQGFTLENPSQSTTLCTCIGNKCSWNQKLTSCKATKRPINVSTAKSPQSQSQNVNNNNEQKRNKDTNNDNNTNNIIKTGGCTFKNLKIPKDFNHGKPVCQTDGATYDLQTKWRWDGTRKPDGTNCALKCDNGWKVADAGKRQVDANCSCKVRRVRGEMQAVCTWDNWNLSWCERDSSFNLQPQLPVAKPQEEKPSPWIKTSPSNIPKSLEECKQKIPEMNNISTFECFNGQCRTRCDVRQGQKAVIKNQDTTCKCVKKKVRVKNSKKKKKEIVCDWTVKIEQCSAVDVQGAGSLFADVVSDALSRQQQIGRALSVSSPFPDFDDGELNAEIPNLTRDFDYGSQEYNQIQPEIEDNGLPSFCQIEELQNTLNSYRPEHASYDLNCSSDKSSCKFLLNCSNYGPPSRYKQRGPKEFNCRCSARRGCYWAPGQNFKAIRCFDTTKRAAWHQERSEGIGRGKVNNNGGDSENHDDQQPSQTNLFRVII